MGTYEFWLILVAMLIAGFLGFVYLAGKFGYLNNDDKKGK